LITIYLNIMCFNAFEIVKFKSASDVSWNTRFNLNNVFVNRVTKCSIAKS